MLAIQMILTVYLRTIINFARIYIVKASNRLVRLA